jgi:hypothetical protein
MNKLLWAAGLLVALSVGSNSMSLNAQSSAVTPRQATILESIQASVIRAIGAEEGTVEMATTPNILSVMRVNSNMNGSTHEGRNSEAREIASKVMTEIKGKPEFKEIATIRVDYSERSSSTDESKVVDSVEFRRRPDGAFEFHQS